ncbi:DASH complex subunit Duo1-domain-containing protein [Rhypophila decipiens]|uniref:DASH complex subunit DUO1 n=1 Tax=Rhypophila decipiens TaxID=261697 RepID=A0AAN6YEU1_9PEZI|nr:DASH complex subunit Duo1-domain-containing protein [Rhypophila decipiens]
MADRHRIDGSDQEDEEDVFASPSPSKPPRGSSKRPAAAQQQPSSTTAEGRSKTPTTTPANQNTRFDTQETREAALRRELEGVRNINQVIEGVIGTLERAKGNMGTVSQTVNNASTLLNTWTRILSQTEHNQRLILNPNWKGSTQDLQDIENEAIQKQQEAERQAAERERRREEARRKAEEEERKRTAGVPVQRSGSVRGSSVRGSRGIARGRGGLTRGGAPVAARTDSGQSSTYGTSRTTSGIGRGFGSTRGTRGGTGTGTRGTSRP